MLAGSQSLSVDHFCRCEFSDYGTKIKICVIQEIHVTGDIR